MSTEIQTYSQPQAASLPDKMAFAKALAQAGMIPRVYQDAPANVLVAIELGDALGIAPIVAINEINVINGTPSPSASLMVSLARAAGHKVRVYNADDGAGVCEIIRADDPEFTHRSRWDEAKARKGGLWGKGHWAKDPDTMLRWRAASECVRLACSEVLGGLKYTPEEVLEMDRSPQFRPAHTVDETPGSEESPQVNAPHEQPAPKSKIPSSLGDKIAESDDVDWLTKSRAYLDRFEDDEPEQVADLQALIDARIHNLTAEPKVAEEPTHDEAEQTLTEVLDAEVVDA